MKTSTLLLGSAAAFLIIGGGTKTMIDLKNASENEKAYAPMIANIEKKYSIPSGLLHKLIKAESAFRSDIITGKKRSSTGALGIAQFMPATAREWIGTEAAALNPALALDGAARYLKWLYAQVGNDWTKAVAAYNWGIGNVKKKTLASAPTETKNYVKKILGVSIA